MRLVSVALLAELAAPPPLILQKIDLWMRPRPYWPSPMHRDLASHLSSAFMNASRWFQWPDGALHRLLLVFGQGLSIRACTDAMICCAMRRGSRCACGLPMRMTHGGLLICRKPSV